MEPSENAEDPRHDILVRYRRFEITREQADAEAQALGFESLEFRPDPREFDPLTLPFWTLPMTLAWIIYRAREPVQELIEAYRAASLVWRHTGQFSINSGKPEKSLRTATAGTQKRFVAYEARYRDVQDGGSKWKTLAFQIEAGIPVDAVSGWGENRPRFTQVILRGADVVALWPAPLGTDDAAKQMLARPAESLTAANALPGGIPERLLFSARRAELQRHAFVSQKPFGTAPVLFLRAVRPPVGATRMAARRRRPHDFRGLLRHRGY